MCITNISRVPDYYFGLLSIFRTMLATLSLSPDRCSKRGDHARTPPPCSTAEKPQNLSVTVGGVKSSSCHNFSTALFHARRVHLTLPQKAARLNAVSPRWFVAFTFAPASLIRNSVTLTLLRRRPVTPRRRDGQGVRT